MYRTVMLALSSQYCSCFGVNHSVIYFILTSWTLLHMLFLSRQEQTNTTAPRARASLYCSGLSQHRLP